MKTKNVTTPPNDPSSPTPAPKTPNCQPEGNAGVGCSAWLGGILPYELSPSEKEEVRAFIREVYPQSQNSIIVLDKSDLTEDAKGLLSVTCRDKAVTQSESRSLLSLAREYIASQGLKISEVVMSSKFSVRDFDSCKDFHNGDDVTMPPNDPSSATAS